MAEKEVILTYEGLKKLEDELAYLKTTKKIEVAERIKEARGFGDLSENSEYDDAKNEQAEVESRINVIENMLRNAKVVSDDEVTHAPDDDNIWTCKKCGEEAVILG